MYKALDSIPSTCKKKKKKPKTIIIKLKVFNLANPKLAQMICLGSSVIFHQNHNQGLGLCPSHPLPPDWPLVLPNQVLSALPS
jgi:hypothetical protein